MRYLDLRRMVIMSVDLPAFVESEVGVNVTWRGDRTKCKCKCPFPGHGDSDPSFSMTLHEDGWGYRCFGCGATGTIVEFVMEYYGIDSPSIALETICKLFGLEDEAAMMRDLIERPMQSRNQGKMVMQMHLMASNQCRLLLWKSGSDKETAVWAAARFREMNAAVEDDDYGTLEMIYDRACELFDEKDFCDVVK